MLYCDKSFHGVSQIRHSVDIFDEEYIMAWPGELGEQALYFLVPTFRSFFENVGEKPFYIAEL